MVFNVIRRFKMEPSEEEMQKGGEMEHMVPVKNDGAVAKVKSLSYSAARGVRRALVSAVAVAVMLVAYGVSTIGAIGSSALGITSVAGIAALTTSATPANAHRYRRRRRYYSRRRYRRYRGYRRRRRGGIYIYF